MSMTVDKLKGIHEGLDFALELCVDTVSMDEIRHKLSNEHVRTVVEFKQNELPHHLEESHYRNRSIRNMYLVSSYTHNVETFKLVVSEHKEHWSNYRL